MNMILRALQTKIVKTYTIIPGNDEHGKYEISTIAKFVTKGFSINLCIKNSIQCKIRYA